MLIGNVRHLGREVNVETGEHIGPQPLQSCHFRNHPERLGREHRAQPLQRNGHHHRLTFNHKIRLAALIAYSHHRAALRRHRQLLQCVFGMHAEQDALSLSHLLYAHAQPVDQDFLQAALERGPFRRQEHRQPLPKHIAHTAGADRRFAYGECIQDESVQQDGMRIAVKIPRTQKCLQCQVVDVAILLQDEFADRQPLAEICSFRFTEFCHCSTDRRA